MTIIDAKCLLCGKTYQLTEDYKDYKKLSDKSSENNAAVSFICDLCSHKVRHESDEERKPKKPM